MWIFSFRHVGDKSIQWFIISWQIGHVITNNDACFRRGIFIQLPKHPLDVYKGSDCMELLRFDCWLHSVSWSLFQNEIKSDARGNLNHSVKYQLIDNFYTLFIYRSCGIFVGFFSLMVMQTTAAWHNRVSYICKMTFWYWIRALKLWNIISLLYVWPLPWSIVSQY